MVDDVMSPASSPESASLRDLPAGSAPSRRLDQAWTSTLARWGSAVAAGLLMWLAFPPYDLWFLAPVGVAVLALAAHRRGLWFGAGLGLVAGLTLLIPLLWWAGGFVGPVWLFLPVGESGYFALLGVLSALASPVVDRWRWSWPLLTGSLWVLQEALRDRTPFGGFPWGRLAFSQGDSPLLRLAALGGAPLVTFGVGAVGGLLALAVLTVRTGRGTAAIAAGTAIALTAAPMLLPIGTAKADGTVRVAVVQGNVPRLGLEFNAQRRAVLDNHVSATKALADDVKAGRAQQPDLVVWPENSSDIDPIRNPDATRQINDAANAIGVPILVGGLLDPDNAGTDGRSASSPTEDGLRNVGLVWVPGKGPTEQYIKQHPVPFAEYIPMRSIVRHITSKVDLVQTDFVAGPTPGVLHVGPVTVGDVICFEVAYDNIPRDTVTGGAQLLVVQTNNATFDEAEARQQLAMVRLRAVEHGKPAVMASTVGVSAFVDSAGTVYDATRFNTPAVIERDLTLQPTRTPATTLGELPELALVVVALGLLLAGVMLRRTKREVGR